MPGAAPGRLAGDAQEAQAVAPDDDLVAVLERPAVDARAVDEHAVEAAVVEQAHAVGLAHDQRVAARDGRVVEAHVGGEAAPDPRPLARQRDRPQLAAVLVAEVLAGLLDLRPGLRQPLARGRGPAAATSVRFAGSARVLGGEIRSVLNSEARAKSRPPQLGQSVRASEPVERERVAAVLRSGTNPLRRRCPR